MMTIIVLTILTVSLGEVAYGASTSSAVAPPSGCHEPEVLDDCLAWGQQKWLSGSKMRISGCKAFARGWKKGSFKGCRKRSGCPGTSRDYAACDHAECAAFCSEMYDARKQSLSNLSDVERCVKGCEKYAELLGEVVQEDTPAPTAEPIPAPTPSPTASDTPAPTAEPTQPLTDSPTQLPTNAPTQSPTEAPTNAPTKSPTDSPTQSPTDAPTNAPTDAPTQAPTSSAQQIKANYGICLDAAERKKAGGRVSMWTCHNGINQQWTYNPETGQIKSVDGYCLDASQRSTLKGKVHMWPCNTNNKNQMWTYTPSTGQIKATHGLCLDAAERNTLEGRVSMWTCDTTNKNQMWTISGDAKGSPTGEVECLSSGTWCDYQGIVAKSCDSCCSGFKYVWYKLRHECK